MIHAIKNTSVLLMRFESVRSHEQKIFTYNLLFYFMKLDTYKKNEDRKKLIYSLANIK